MPPNRPAGRMQLSTSGCPLTPSPTPRSCVLRTTCGGGAPTTAAAPSPSTCSSTPWASWSTRCTSEGARTRARAPLLPQRRHGLGMVKPACSSAEVPTQCLSCWGARRGFESRVTPGERCPAPWAHATTGCCPRLSLCARHPPALCCASARAAPPCSASSCPFCRPAPSQPHRLHPRGAVRVIHEPDGVVPLPGHGHHRLPLLLHLHVCHLQCQQEREWGAGGRWMGCRDAAGPGSGRTMLARTWKCFRRGMNFYMSSS